RREPHEATLQGELNDLRLQTEGAQQRLVPRWIGADRDELAARLAGCTRLLRSGVRPDPWVRRLTGGEAIFPDQEGRVMRLGAWLPYLLLSPPAVAGLAEADRFPERMPVHWGLNGVANGFVTRSTLSLLAPLIFLAGLLLFLDGIVALGSRTGPPVVTAAVQR